MFDCHYDLLTYILMKKENPDFLKNYCTKVYRRDNIIGGIFNLFYMSEKEMQEEIGISKDQIDVIDNLREVKEYIQKHHLLSDNVTYIFGIEGLDYLENIDDIDILYSLGLRSTNPVWNNQNKFGSGIRTDQGLTELGKKLIQKLIQKKIAIDLSHTNEQTFRDIIDVCRQMKKDSYEPIVFASHSNVKALCDVQRNLTDEQIKAIKELNGTIGVTSIKRFCIKDVDVNEPNTNFVQSYINHINYIKDLLGNVDNITVSTDDMRYYYIEPEYYQHANIFKHDNIKTPLTIALKNNGYTEEEINQILQTNFKHKILKKII